MFHETRNVFSKFTHKYSLSKTLKCELKPVSETKNYLQEFIDLDEIRAKEYKELKIIIDEFHKDHIENTLSSKNILDNEDIKELFDLWKLKDNEDNKKEIESLQKKLRKQIVEHFKSSNHLFKNSINKSHLFSKEFIRCILPEWLENSNLEEKEKKQKLIKKFDKFTTYLTGFYENRKNMYSDQEQGTAIAYRIVNENLPKFFSNLQAYEKIETNYKDLKSQIESIKKELKEEFNYFNIKQIDNLFKLEFFNQCLSQKEIDHYNTLLGGKTLKSKEKIRGINEYINLYRQNSQNKNKNKDTIIKYSNKNLPVMELLYKQILSDKESRSFILDNFESKKNLLDSIQEFSNSVLKPKEAETSNLLKKIKQLFTENLSENDRNLNAIYIKNSQINIISKCLFNDWSLIGEALNDYSDKSPFQKAKEKSKKKNSKKDFYSFEEVNKALVQYLTENDNWHLKDKSNNLPQQNLLILYFRKLFHYGRDKTEKLFWSLSDNKMESEDKLLNSFKQTQLEFTEIYNSFQEKQVQNFNEKEIEIIQKFLNLFMDLFHIIDQVYLEKDGKKVIGLEKDINFYNKLECYRKSLFPVISIYNKTRNFILSNEKTKEKIKINFEDSTLLNGWDVNKETDNLAVLLRKTENNFWKYYLGIMNKNNSKTANHLFDYHKKDDDSEKKKKNKEELKDRILQNSNNENFYEKMNYKQISDANKDIQNLMQINGKVQRKTKNLTELKEKYLPSEIWKIKETKSYSVDKNSNSFNEKDLIRFIDFYKEIAKTYWKGFNFNFKNSDKYNNFKDFTDDINSQGYKISFDKIKSNYIEEKIKTGELLLFEIYNKDFSTKSKSRGKSKDNLHTLYFKGLFEEENLKDTILKLNGQAEIFYRKASFKTKRVIHPRNQAIKNKNENPKSESMFEYDIIKDKRFFEDKFFFHFPISLNFKEKELKPNIFNQEVLRFLKDNKDVNIIGIDRGERHLAYYTVIDQNRKILKQSSFNKMFYSYKNNTGKKIEIEKDYHELLENREKQRDKNRKEWKQVENIKELKSGYLSYLVHKLSHLMMEYNAIIVFEDLNSGFKRGRFKFEKQVYQKLEKALIDKLNYLVFKDNKALEAGGYLNAYQLTAPFESFKKMGKQTGFLFYTPAYYTSKVCPLTGFVNLIYPKYKNTKQSQDFFNRFERIYFDKQKDYFVFEYSDFNFKKKESKNFWKVCTYGEERYKWNNKERTFIKMNITQKLKKLFEKYEIDYTQLEDLKPSIIKQTEKNFFFKLIDYLKITLQLRYTNPNTTDENEKDFILSPVPDKNGYFFDSRKVTNNEPKNADANGAYHIALKGLMSLKDIKTDKKENLQIQPIKNKDWFDFLRYKEVSLNKQKAG